MIEYEMKKGELLQLNIEMEDEVRYYNKKIQEFELRKQKEIALYKSYKERLDDYVLNNYKEDKFKAWEHFLTTQKTKKTEEFFSRFFKNTGLAVSKSNDEVKIVLKPEDIVNLKKSVDTLNVLFEMSKRIDLGDFKIKVLDLRQKQSGLILYYDDKNSHYIVRKQDGKRAIYKERSILLMLNKLMKVNN